MALLRRSAGLRGERGCRPRPTAEHAAASHRRAGHNRRRRRRPRHAVRLGHGSGGDLLPTAYCLLPTAYCLQPTAYCLLPTACLLPTGTLGSWIWRGTRPAPHGPLSTCRRGCTSGSRCARGARGARLPHRRHRLPQSHRFGRRPPCTQRDKAPTAGLQEAAAWRMAPSGEAEARTTTRRSRSRCCRSPASLAASTSTLAGRAHFGCSTRRSPRPQMPRRRHLPPRRRRHRRHRRHRRRHRRRTLSATSYRARSSRTRRSNGSSEKQSPCTRSRPQRVPRQGRCLAQCCSHPSWRGPCARALGSLLGIPGTN